MKDLILAVSVCILLFGCSTTDRFTVISNKLVDTSGFDITSPAQPVEEKNVRHVFLGIIKTKEEPHMGNAMDKALSSGQGDVIVNSKVRHWHWVIPSPIGLLLYEQEGWKVKGEVVKTRMQGP